MCVVVRVNMEEKESLAEKIRKREREREREREIEI